jgi:uncharacterized membrane protein
MSFEDWIFALHVLGAATLVGGLVMSWIVLVAFRSVEDARATLSLHRVSLVASAAVIAGLVLAIGFGVWLAILRVAFHPWDAWVIAAIVLWCVATALIVRSFAEYAKPVKKARALIAAGESGANAELRVLNRTSTGLLLRAAASAAIVVIVIDMIYKPGA